MKTPTRTRAGAAASAAALVLGFAGSAFAQAAGGTVGGTTTDMTSAGNVNGDGMPQIQRQGPVEYVSGGVGQDESTALERAGRQWPLALRFTGPGAEYVADVKVRIVDAQNAEVLNAQSRGPYMLVKLPPGRYVVHARYNEREHTRSVSVAERSGAHAEFHWGTR